MRPDSGGRAGASEAQGNWNRLSRWLQEYLPDGAGLRVLTGMPVCIALTLHDLPYLHTGTRGAHRMAVSIALEEGNMRGRFGWKLASGLLLVSRIAFGQSGSEQPRFEAGAQLTSIRLNALGESPLGIGGRFGYHLNDHLALDAQLNYFPENPSGNFGETQVLAGMRLGSRVDRWGIYARAGAGAIHFGGDFFDLRLSSKTHFALDLGGSWSTTPPPTSG